MASSRSSAPSLPKPRRDALPEGHCYPDSPCCADESLSAFDCPLAVCLMDLPRGHTSQRADANREQVGRLAGAGKKAGEIAETLGVSKRQVFRYLAGVREARRA